MSDLTMLDIQKFLEKERFQLEQIKIEIQEKQEELLRCQGKILAYEELLKNTTGELSSGLMGGFSSGLDNKSFGLNEKRKDRAPRTTKREMERRRQMVARVFTLQGDLSAKELQPLVEDLLGYEMEPHHLRAVLRKFSDDFIQRDDHGIWGLRDSNLLQPPVVFEGTAFDGSPDDSTEEPWDTE